eukprot:1834681-Rhodomonas_salina.1
MYDHFAADRHPHRSTHWTARLREPRTRPESRSGALLQTECTMERTSRYEESEPSMLPADNTARQIPAAPISPPAFNPPPQTETRGRSEPQVKPTENSTTKPAEPTDTQFKPEQTTGSVYSSIYFDEELEPQEPG